MPGLDGMRALAVVTVMIYHANSGWLKGGFLGVEVFFVISGYLITLLLISEHERDHSVDMKQFWIRRARRLLPALFVMLFMLTLWTALFERSTLGKLRGDIVRRARVWLQLVPGVHGPGVRRGQRLRAVAPSVEPRGRGAVLPDLADRDGAPAAGRQPGDRQPQPLAGRCRRGHHGARRAPLSPGPDRDATRSRRRRTGTSSAATSPRPTSSTCRRSPVPAVCCSVRRSPWCGDRSRSCAGRCATARLLDGVRRSRPRGARPDDVVGRFHRVRTAPTRCCSAAASSSSAFATLGGHRGDDASAARSRRRMLGIPALVWIGARSYGCTCTTGRSTS